MQTNSGKYGSQVSERHMYDFHKQRILSKPFSFFFYVFQLITNNVPYAFNPNRKNSDARENSLLFGIQR